MDERQMRIRVGLFVLGGLVVLAVASTLFTGLFNVFRSYDAYTVLFTSAPGIGPGTPVRRSGIRIGDVKSVKLDENSGQVHVELRVEKGQRFRAGDEATQVRALIGGDPAIDIVAKRDPTPADAAPLAPGARITAATGPDMRDLLTQTQDLVPSTQETMNEIRKSVQRFEKMAPQIEETIKEYHELAKATRQTIPEIRRTMDEAQVAAKNWGKVGERVDVLLQTNQDKLVQTLDNIAETVRRVATVFNEENQRNAAKIMKNTSAASENFESLTKNADELLKNSRQTVDRLNQSLGKTDEILTNVQKASRPFAERSAPIMKNLDELTEKLNILTTEFGGALRAGSQGDGSLRRFLTDPSLYNNINDAACMLARMLPRLDRILRDAEVFADKIARHPESLGVGGAIRPSGGLKEAPTGRPNGH